MKVQYKREMRHNYLILNAMEENLESFEIRMLTCNSIEGILHFRVKRGETCHQYYYEITSKQPLSRLLELKEIRREELGKLITGIGIALNHMEEYLLQESNVLLEPEYIYIEPDTYQVWLCYVPGYQGDFPASMGKLLHFLLKKADHQDNDTVVLAYRLYQESQKDYFGIQDLLRAVKESQKGEENHPYQNQNSSQGKERKKADWEEMDAVFPEKEESSAACGVLLPAEKEKQVIQEKQRIETKGGEKARRKKGRKETKLAAGVLAGFLLLLPLSIWLLLGKTGLELYWMELAAAQGVAVALYILFLIRGRRKEKKTEGESKNSRKKETSSQWYMTFEDEGNEVEEREESQEIWDKKEKIRSGRAALWAEEGQEEKTIMAACEEAGNTVLLAEADGTGSMSHLLKSLDPSVEDIPILYFPFIIGKQEGIVDYALKKDTVSRLHVRIDMEEKGCLITDLNSSNGTSISGRGLEANESCLICSGDKIQIADLSFVFY